MSAADVQQLHGGVGIKLASVEGVQGLQQERQGDALQELVLFKDALDAPVTRRARLFVGLRFAPASSKPGPAGDTFLISSKEKSESHFVLPAVSFCSRPDMVFWHVGHFMLSQFEL